ncbi:MAG: hypothetical protein GY838_19425 [bacterium]|nr:hypothetical protein [bacterium]
MGKKGKMPPKAAEEIFWLPRMRDLLLPAKGTIRDRHNLADSDFHGFLSTPHRLPRTGNPVP